MKRRNVIQALAATVLFPGLGHAGGFNTWLNDFKAEARRQGISRNTIDAAFSGIRLQQRVIDNDRKQAEVTRSLQDYIATAASPARIRGGQKALARYKTVFHRIERRYGVPKEVIAAIWGMESSYGSFRGTAPVIATLATLAYEGRRRALFHDELLAALKILQSGQVSAARLTGSYAGAMGHTQFMPSTYLAHAVDFTKDGKRDIWGDDPTDALASTAALLRRNGWKRGQPWAVEARLPKGFDPTLSGRIYPRRVGDWHALGLRQTDGGKLPDHGKSALILPVGPRGPAFLIYQNFHVLKSYNYSDSYVIGVGHLSDRLAGGAPIKASYPKHPWGMTSAQRKALQTRLNAAGFNAGPADGVFGEKSRAAIRGYEKSRGLRVTGVPSPALLDRLR